MNLQDALQDYLHYIQAVDQKSLATIHSYTQDLQEYLSWLQAQGKTEMEDILPRDIQSFLSDMGGIQEDGLRYKRSSVNPVSYTHLDVYKRQAEVPSGSLYPANVISITKAQDNIPGEKHAEIDFSSAFANVLANTNIGIYGHYDSMLRNVEALPWAKHDEVHTGKAVMYTVLQGNTIEPFTINITKVHRQNTSCLLYTSRCV